jgi:hypothetical protein
MEVPHEVGFVQVHGAQLKSGSVKQADCLVCHQTSSCFSCHGIAMPHPAGFVKAHRQQVARLGEKVCYRCHEAASCPSCHQRHIHPGIPTDILRQLQEHPVR